MKPVLEELARKHEGRIDVRVIDLRDPAGAALGEEHAVRLIPTQVFLGPDGKELLRHEGAMTMADIEAELARLGWTR